MSIIVPSSHTGKCRGENPLTSILYSIINCHARISYKHRIHGKFMGYNSVRYITSRIGWVSLKGNFRYRCRRNPEKLYKTGTFF